MSRYWTKQDEKYVIKENIITLNNDIEYLVNMIKVKIEFPINLDNIMDIYKMKISNINNFYEDDFIFRNSIIEYFNSLVEDSKKELIKCINKLDKPIYKKILSSKIILLLIDYNIKKYNKNINLIKNFEIKDNLEELLNIRYESKKNIYSDIEIDKLKEKDKYYIDNNVL